MRGFLVSHSVPRAYRGDATAGAVKMCVVVVQRMVNARAGGCVVYS
jgi:hypothetical protein